ncbi:BspR family type III secretion system anti-sigma factor [Achromobacter denitrificans]
MTISSVTPSSPFISLDAFAKAAEGGQDVYVDIAGGRLQVLGTGATPGGRSVAWVAPDVDTTAMFTQTLAQSYGQGIASAVSRELGLAPNPGKPLSARTVAAAIDMAETSSHALSGVDFMTRLATSAAGNTPAFQQACKDVGVAPSGLDAGRRAALDQAMEARFEQAARSGQSPVSLATAAGWLRDLLKTP